MTLDIINMLSALFLNLSVLHGQKIAFKHERLLQIYVDLSVDLRRLYIIYNQYYIWELSVLRIQ